MNGDRTKQYPEINAMMKMLVDLRVSLTNNPSEKNLKHYKLICKIYEAHERIINDPDIMEDTLAIYEDAENDDDDTILITNDGAETKTNSLYMFDSYDKKESAEDLLVDVSDADITTELFDMPQFPEDLPDNKDVKFMLDKSLLQLNRARNTRSYLIDTDADTDTDDEFIIEIASGDGDDEPPPPYEMIAPQ